MRNKLMGAAAMLAILSFAAACDQATGTGGGDNRREKIVECSLYLQGLGTANFMGDRRLVEGVEAALQKDMPDLQNKLSLLGRAATQYSEDVDVARVAVLETDARDRLRKHVADNDVRGSTAYVKTCFSTFDALGRG